MQVGLHQGEKDARVGIDRVVEWVHASGIDLELQVVKSMKVHQWLPESYCRIHVQIVGSTGRHLQRVWSKR